jgi:hypothetical protein
MELLMKKYQSDRVVIGVPLLHAGGLFTAGRWPGTDVRCAEATPPSIRADVR